MANACCGGNLACPPDGSVDASSPNPRGQVQPRIDGRTFRLLQGEEHVKAWRHPDGGFEKCFCSECGAHLFSRNPDDPTQMSIRMGAFDHDPGVRPTWRA